MRSECNDAALGSPEIQLRVRGSAGWCVIRVEEHPAPFRPWAKSFWCGVGGRRRAKIKGSRYRLKVALSSSFWLGLDLTE